ncbi:hypothetical protein BS78_01G009900 [Paspalum vaginatum]|nr:hypothetical protein BS78_01G009900 [Paspalum vaginatum]KAJ1292697.1 hypothetical protein BS78_01G009900 [Paspalum vaginatum]
MPAILFGVQPVLEEAMVKRKLRDDAVPPPRERNIIWHEDQTRFLLEWCIEYKKKQHADFKFRRPHLALCADALNKKFAMGVTIGQVDRHFRYHKENWGFITRALSSSGNTFDIKRHMVKVSEPANLSDRERRLFGKPIKWFQEMQELFSDSSATSSFAKDQNTCLSDGNDSDSDDSKELIDLNCYVPTEDHSVFWTMEEHWMSGVACLGSSSWRCAPLGYVGDVLWSECIYLAVGFIMAG